MWIIYVIQHDETKDRYIGKTNNLKRRLFEHNRKHQNATRRIKGKWIVVYCEIFKSKEDADERELKLKHHGRSKQELFKRIKKSLDN